MGGRKEVGGEMRKLIELMHSLFCFRCRVAACDEYVVSEVARLMRERRAQ